VKASCSKSLGSDDIGFRLGFWTYSVSVVPWIRSNEANGAKHNFMKTKRTYYLETLSPEKRKEVARLGGLKSSLDRARMSANGKKGGMKVAQNKAHMRRIAQLGVEARRRKALALCG
jgi:hypothetical protein